MKKIVLSLVCACVFIPLPFLRAQEAAQKAAFPGLRKAMSSEEYEAAGLQRLSADERAALDEFIRGYLSSSNERVAEKAATAAVDRAVEAHKAQAPDVIQSRIVGPFSGYNGRTTFTLENGQRWAQSQRDSAYYRTIDSPPVLIVKGQIGYRMYIAGGGDIRVQLVK
jgi:hypothetical protein